MKNYCGILEHDYGCNCINAETRVLSHDLAMEKYDSELVKRFIDTMIKTEPSFEEINENIKILSKKSDRLITPQKLKHPSNLTPKKKKRKR